MSGIRLVAIIAVLGIGTFVAMSSIYTVSEVEQAIITQFGKPIGAPVTTAGLKVKVPFIQDVNLMDKRVLEWDGNPTDNAVAKHELIEIIRTTKNRVPLRDTLLTGAGPEKDMGSLVPIQKGRKLVEQEIFESNCSISGSSGSTTMKACARRSTIE